MATIYSLICWGGKDGKSVSVSSTTDYVTLSNHGLRDATGVAFTAGTLPSVSGAALALNTTYYSKSISVSTFELYYDAALTNKIDFTSNGASLVIKSAYYLGLSSTSRWGSNIFDSLTSWNSARAAAASQFDEEVAELGQAFDDWGGVNITIPAGSVTVTSRINGLRTAAFHGGVYGAGYIAKKARSSSTVLVQSQRQGTTFDGFTAKFEGGGSYLCNVFRAGLGGHLLNMIAAGESTATEIGFAGGTYTRTENCLAINLGGYGFQFGSYYSGMIVANCLATKCNVGFGTSSATNISGYFYNNIAVGNTTDWGSTPSGMDGASNNAGGGTPWALGASPSFSIATTDFLDWANNDFSPASAASPQVDAAAPFYEISVTDIADAERPNYNNGGAEGYDLGPYEFDHGYGPHPQSQPIEITDVIDGSRVKIAKQSDGGELYNDVLSGTTTVSYTEGLSTVTPVYLYVRKGSTAPFYKPLKLSATVDPETGLSQSLAGLQIADIARASSYASGVATDWSFNPGTGAISHDAGSTIYTVRDLYSYYRDYTDDSATVDDTLLMDGTTPTVFSLINGGSISDADLQYLKGGSVEFPDGTLWSSLYSVGTLAGSPDIYLYQNGAKLTQFWPAGHIDVLVKAAAAGVLIDSGRLTGYARAWGYTYDHYEVDLSGGGRAVMPLSTAADPNITQSEATVGDWSDVAVSFSTYSLDFGDGAGAQTYYCRIDCNSRPLAEVYQRLQYLTRGGAAGDLNGAAGECYQRAHASLAAVKAAPFGTRSGGVWSLAPGVWLDNVASGDLYSFILTDVAGGAHQNVQALYQSVTINGVEIGSRVQIYDTTNAAELYNGIADATTVSWQDVGAPTVDRAIRLRVAYVSGTDARGFIEANIGTCGTAAGNKDVTYLVSQSVDAVYNANAINGSTVTGVSFTDSTVDVMNIDIDAGEVNLGHLYAAWVYYAFSEAGIATDIDYIEAVDQANYIYSNLRWKNTTSPTVPLKITGGYAWDSSTLDPIDLVDTSGGTVFLAPPHVVAKTITISGGNVVTGDISDIPALLPSAAAVADAVWSKTLP